MTYSAEVGPILAARCGGCHTGGGSGGHDIGSSFNDTQLPSYYCAGETKGYCALVRIQDGSMPLGASCTGNPSLDAGRPECLTRAEIQALQAWVAHGQPE